MHVKDLLLLAVDVVLGAPQASARGRGVPQELLNQYWLASKGCQDTWFHRMKQYREQFPLGDAKAGRAAWRQIRSVLEEVLAGEVFSRTWAAAVAVWEQGLEPEAEPVVRSVVVAHTEARLRAMMLLLHAPGVPAAEAAELNRLANRATRWCDMLVGRLVPYGPVAHWAFNPRRAQEYAQDLNPVEGKAAQAAARKLLRASLQRAFWPLLVSPPACPRLLESIFYSVAPLLPAPVVAASPHADFAARWEKRLQQVSDYAQGLIEDLVALERGVCPRKSAS